MKQEVQIDLGIGGAIEDQGQTRGLVAHELRGVDRCFKSGLRPRWNNPGADMYIRASALGAPINDAELGVRSVDDGEGVSNLRASSNRTEIVSSARAERTRPSQGFGPGSADRR